jgi:hypothetical protein
MFSIPLKYMAHLAKIVCLFQVMLPTSSLQMSNLVLKMDSLFFCHFSKSALSFSSLSFTSILFFHLHTTFKIFVLRNNVMWLL